MCTPQLQLFNKLPGVQAVKPLGVSPVSAIGLLNRFSDGKNKDRSQPAAASTLPGGANFGAGG